MYTNKKIFKLVCIFLLIVTIFVIVIFLKIIVNDNKERFILTKKYEETFLKFLNSGVYNEFSEPYFSNYDIKAFKTINSKEFELDISNFVSDYMRYIIKISNVNLEEGDYNWFNYTKNFYNDSENKKIIGHIEFPYFVKKDLLKISDISESALVSMLINKFKHKGDNININWTIDKYESIKETLIGNITFEYLPPQKNSLNRIINYNNFTILSPLYRINYVTRKRFFNNEVKIKLNYTDNGVDKELICIISYNSISNKYSISNIYEKIFGKVSDYEAMTFKVYNYEEVEYLTKLESISSAEQSENYLIPDVIDNACKGNIVDIFNAKFKKKIKNEGLFDSFKVKDTKKIILKDSVQEKELRELILDDEHNTKILCIFKIVYTFYNDYENYEGGGPEEVGDILTYIIPEENMNLSYDEMYQLAFND